MIREVNEKVFIHTAIFLDVASVRRNGEVGMLALMTADGVGSIFPHQPIDWNAKTYP